MAGDVPLSVFSLDPAMTRAHTVLLLGPSGILYVEGRPGETMADHLGVALARRHPEIVWKCEPGLLYVSEGMVRRAVGLAEKSRPDAIALLLGAPAFADDFVVNRIRRLWPRAYPFALRISERLKALAGGGSEGARGVRGLIFRLPRWLALRLVGADPGIDVDTAIRCAIETIDALLRFEDTALACRLSFPVPFYHSERQEHLNRVARFNSVVAAHCQSRRIPHYDLQATMEEIGDRPGFVGDGVHPDPRTQQFDMGLMAERVAGALLE
jgi:hypothetical protein